jgi:monoamine oxidase
MAGLAAARELLANGYRVTVLEARSRIGGRIWTDTSIGAPVDLGASWIQGVDGNPVGALARSLRVPTVATGENVAAFDHDGRRLSDQTVREVEKDFDALTREVESLAGSLDRDISIGAAIQRVLQGERLDEFEQRALNWAMASLSTDSAADLDVMSLLHADDDKGFDGDDVIVPGGYARIVEGMTGGAEIRLEHRVTRVAVEAAGVRVETSRGPVAADRVIVTLPLGVLQAGTVSFSPPLSARKREAISRLRMGVLNKVVLKFDRAFWPDADNFAYLSKTAGEFPDFFNHRKATGQPILVAFAAGTFGQALEARSDRDVQARLMEILRLMGSATPAPVAMVRTRWAADEFTRGSYAYIPVGASPDDRRTLAEPEGRVQFAGEATTTDYPATVHGAYLSGVREAGRLIRG